MVGCTCASRSSSARQASKRALAALRGIAVGPDRIVHRHVEQRQERRQVGRSVSSSVRTLPVTFSRMRRASSALLDLEIMFEQIDQRQIGRRLAVRHRAALQHQPVPRSMRMDELVIEARLPDAGLADHGDHLSHGAVPARSSAAFSASISRSRPTKRVKPATAEACRRVRTALAPVSSKTSTGCATPLDRDRAERRNLHEAFRQPQRIGGHADGAGERQLLHARREMRGLADGVVVHGQVVADGPHHDLTRVQTGAHLYLNAEVDVGLFRKCRGSRSASRARHNRPSPHDPRARSARRTTP